MLPRSYSYDVTPPRGGHQPHRRCIMCLVSLSAAVRPELLEPRAADPIRRLSTSLVKRRLRKISAAGQLSYHLGTAVSLPCAWVGKLSGCDTVTRLEDKDTGFTPREGATTVFLDR
eukprot:scaffold294145_cov35-Prasinocladus_malaysianus.AAC.2